jgi:Na+-translocating ferredoxin:NAD+ oxidoreductase subunit C
LRNVHQNASAEIKTQAKLQSNMKTVSAPYQFKGGIHPDYHKELSGRSAIERMPNPLELTVPMSQHLGSPAKVCVSPGDTVKKGSLIGEQNGFISVPVHAPLSGTVKAVVQSCSAAGRSCQAVVIESMDDGATAYLEPIDEWFHTNRERLRNRIGEAGIAGMGGAGFPTRVKLSPPHDKPIDTVILNGAECEPYLTSDYRVMLEHADKIRIGAEIVQHILGAKTIRIAIEDNKPDAIRAMEKSCAHKRQGIEIDILPTGYPQGSEKQQIYSVTGREVPRGGLPMDVGCVVENVGTSLAIYEAVVHGQPLIERVVTVTGEAIGRPANLLTPFGTSYRKLIEHCGGIRGSVAKVISGGPMMGFAVSSLEIPTGKTTSGLVLLPPESIQQFSSQACISCGRCVDACPMGLVPSELSQFIEADEITGAERIALMDCIECGSCAFVCPAHRPLVQHMRRGKAAVMARRVAVDAKTRK